MLWLKPHSRSRSVASAHIQAFTFIALASLTPENRCVSRRAERDSQKRTPRIEQQHWTVTLKIFVFGRCPLVNPQMRNYTAPCANLTKQNWSNTLPFQQFQALKTLFQKSPVRLSFIVLVCYRSETYIDLLDEVYRLLRAPFLRNVTPRVHTVRAELQMTEKTPTCSGNLFQGVASAPTLVLHLVITSQGWKAWFSTLNLSQFIRRYQGNI